DRLIDEQHRHHLCEAGRFRLQVRILGPEDPPRAGLHQQADFGGDVKGQLGLDRPAAAEQDEHEQHKGETTRTLEHSHSLRIPLDPLANSAPGTDLLPLAFRSPAAAGWRLFPQPKTASAPKPARRSRTAPGLAPNPHPARRPPRTRLRAGAYNAERGRAAGWRCMEDVARETHAAARRPGSGRSEEHTSELQSRENLVCRLLLEKKKRMTDSAQPR